MSEEFYDNWNQIKKETSKENILVGFKTRDIFNVKIGHNIGYEQNGKGKDFVRPVVVYKKLTKDMFIGIPLTTTIREGNFFYSFEFIPNKRSVAILSQAKLFSSKRLLNKIGVIKITDFEELKEKYFELLK
jgi:mRNA interferase MazF